MVRFCAVLVAASALVLCGCRPWTVRLAFAPKAGATYRYAVHVRSTSVTRLSGQAPQTRTDEIDLTASDVVLGSDGSGSRLRVTISRSGSPVADYTVRLDRQAALVAIEAINGAPSGGLSAGLGGLQLQDLLPAAVGAPPDRPLQAGDSWRTDESLVLPDFQPARLVQTGRLERFGALDGRRVALTTATGALSLDPRLSSAVRVGLRGVQQTTTSVARVVDDGSIEESSARTSGTFDIVLLSGNEPLVTGQLRLDVRSTTRRLA